MTLKLPGSRRAALVEKVVDDVAATAVTASAAFGVVAVVALAALVLAALAIARTR